jgi:hypothetical protein
MNLLSGRFLEKHLGLEKAGQVGKAEKLLFDTAFSRMMLYSRTALPWDFGADPAVRAFCGGNGGLRPGYVSPVEETMQKYVNREWESFLTSVRRTLSDLRAFHGTAPFLSFIHDTCTFANHETYVGVSISFITQKWELSTLALGMATLGDSHASSHVAEIIIDTVRERFSIQNSVCHISFLNLKLTLEANSSLNERRTYVLQSQIQQMERERSRKI